MNLRDLEYVDAVATHKSFSRAATACNVSQPALSSQIKKLELELGVEIFSRQRGDVVLTDYGLRIIDYTQEVLRAAGSIKAAAKNYGNHATIPFAIGMTPTLAPYLIKYFRDALTRLNSAIQVTLVEDKPADLAKKLSSREIDVALLARKTYDQLVESTQATDLLFQTLWFEPLFLAVRQGSSLSRLSTIKAKDVPADRLIHLGVSFGYGLENDLPTEADTKRTSSFDVKGARFETVCRHVSLTDECTIVNSVAAEYFKTCGWGLAFIPFEDPGNMRDVGVVSREGYNQQSFLDDLTNTISKRVPRGTSSPPGLY